MIRVTAAVLEKDAKILIARRKKGGHTGGKWEFPGGKIEQGETPEECLMRELFEEFGVQTTIGGFICSNIHPYQDLTIELLAYKATYISGKFHLHAHEEIKWISPHDLKAYDFADADIPVIDKLTADYYHDI